MFKGKSYCGTQVIIREALEWFDISCPWLAMLLGDKFQRMNPAKYSICAQDMTNFNDAF